MDIILNLLITGLVAYAHQMIATEDYAEAEKLLKDCVYDALNELAEDGIPTEYAGRVEKHDADL